MSSRKFFFKTDIEFKRNIGLSAAGAKYVKEYLEKLGHKIIELENGALTTRIWKNVERKQLRVPDLLCIKCGKRFEVRSKSGLVIRMSHSQRRPWMEDAGLKNDDIIAFVSCRQSGESPYSWKPNQQPVFVSVGTLKETFDNKLIKISDRKAWQSGAELYIEWPSIEAPCNGVITRIDKDKHVIIIKCTNGRNVRKRLKRKTEGGEATLIPWKRVGDPVKAGEIIASIVPRIEPSSLKCHGDPASIVKKYLSYLGSKDFSIVYTAIRALGELLKSEELSPEIKDKIEESLEKKLSEYLDKGNDELAYLLVETYVALNKSCKNKEGLEQLLDQAREIILQDDRLALELALNLSGISIIRALELLSNILSRKELRDEVKGTAIWSIAKGITQLTNLQTDHLRNLIAKYIEILIANIYDEKLIKYIGEAFLIMSKRYELRKLLLLELLTKVIVTNTHLASLTVWLLLRIPLDNHIIEEISRNISSDKAKTILDYVLKLRHIEHDLRISTNVVDELERAYILWDFESEAYW